MDHRLMDVATSLRTGRACAICACGWSTPHYPTAGLAETLLAAHVRRELARDLSVGAALADLEGRRLIASEAEQATLDAVAAAITERSRHPAGIEPPVVGVTTVATVTSDRAARVRLAATIAGCDGFSLVGAASSGVEGVAVAVVERPLLLVVHDNLTDMTGAHCLRLVRTLRVESRLCLLSDAAVPSPDADVVLGADGDSSLVALAG